MTKIQRIEKELIAALDAAKRARRAIGRSNGYNCVLRCLSRYKGFLATGPLNQMAADILGIKGTQAWCIMSGWDGRTWATQAGAALDTRFGRELYAMGEKLGKKYVG